MSVAIDIPQAPLFIKIPLEVSSLNGLDQAKQAITAYIRFQKLFKCEKALGISGYVINFLNLQSLAIQKIAPYITKKISGPMLLSVSKAFDSPQALKLLSITFTVTCLSVYYLSQFLNKPFSDETSQAIIFAAILNLALTSLTNYLKNHPSDCYRLFDCISKGLSLLADEIYQSPIITKMMACILLWYFLNESIPRMEISSSHFSLKSHDIVLMTSSLLFCFADRFALLLKDFSSMASVCQQIAVLETLSQTSFHKRKKTVIDQYHDHILVMLERVRNQKSKTLVALEMQKHELHKGLTSEFKSLTDLRRQVETLEQELEAHKKKPFESYLSTQEARSSPITVVRHKSVTDLELQRRKEVDIEIIARALELKKAQFFTLSKKYDKIYAYFQLHLDRIKKQLHICQKDQIAVYNENALCVHRTLFEKITRAKCLSYLQKNYILLPQIARASQGELLAFVFNDIQKTSHIAMACFHKGVKTFFVKSITRPLTAMILSIIIPYAIDYAIGLTSSTWQKNLLFIASVVNMTGYISFFYQFVMTYKPEDDETLVPRSVSSKQIEKILFEDGMFQQVNKKEFNEQLQLFISCANELKEGSFYEYEELYNRLIKMMKSSDCLTGGEVRILESYMEKLSHFFGSETFDALSVSNEAWYFKEMKKVFMQDVQKQLSFALKS